MKEKISMNNVSAVVLAVLTLFFLIFPGSIGLASFYKFFPWQYLLGGLLGLISLCLIQWFRKKNGVENFYLNKIFTCFVVYYFITDLVHVIKDYDLIIQDNTCLSYTISCVFRLFIFCSVLFLINLLFRTSYNKKFFFKTSFGAIIFLAVLFLSLKVSYIYYSYSMHVPFRFYTDYIVQTKPSMLLLLLILFHIFVDKVGCLYWFLEIFCVFSCSFDGKRGSFFLGVFSLLLVLILPFQEARANKRLRGVFFASGLFILVCLIIKMSTWHSYSNCIFADRICLSRHYLEIFQQQDFIHKLLGNGDILQKVGYPHNVIVSLLLSTGIVGTGLWLLGFIYVLVLFFRFKQRDFIDFILWSILGIHFLYTFTTGFYLYHTPLYFLLYFMEYRYRCLDKNCIENK